MCFKGMAVLLVGSLSSCLLSLKALAQTEEKKTNTWQATANGEFNCEVIGQGTPTVQEGKNLLFSKAILLINDREQPA